MLPCHLISHFRTTLTTTETLRNQKRTYNQAWAWGIERGTSTIGVLRLQTQVCWARPELTLTLALALTLTRVWSPVT